MVSSAERRPAVKAAEVPIAIWRQTSSAERLESCDGEREVRVEWSTDSSHRTTSWQPVMINTGKKAAVRDSSSRLKEREYITLYDYFAEILRLAV